MIRREDAARPVISSPRGGRKGDLRASLSAASVSAVERAAASSRRAGPWRVSQPLCLISARARGVGQWGVGAKQVCDGLAPAQSCRDGWQWMVAGLAVVGVPLWGEQLTAGQVPLSISAWMMARTQELGSICPDCLHRPNGVPRSGCYGDGTGGTG